MSMQPVTPPFSEEERNLAMVQTMQRQREKKESGNILADMIGDIDPANPNRGIMIAIAMLVGMMTGEDPQKLFQEFNQRDENGLASGIYDIDLTTGQRSVRTSSTAFDVSVAGQGYDSGNQIGHRTYTDPATVPYLDLPDSVEKSNPGGWVAYAVTTEAGMRPGNHPMAKGMVVFRDPEGNEHRFPFASGGARQGEENYGGPAPGLVSHDFTGSRSDMVNATYRLGNLEVGGRGAAFSGEGTNFFMHTPSNAQSSVGRSEIGIHPDGNGYGSLGCFAIDPASTREFIAMWNNIPADQRPTEMAILDPQILRSKEHVLANAQVRQNGGNNYQFALESRGDAPAINVAQAAGGLDVAEASGSMDKTPAAGAPRPEELENARS